MNERIEKLIEQCIDQRWTITGPMFDREKFAELIVRECADLVDGYTYPVQTQSHTIYHIASETIKQHFGVDE